MNSEHWTVNSEQWTSLSTYIDHDATIILIEIIPGMADSEYRKQSEQHLVT